MAQGPKIERAIHGPVTRAASGHERSRAVTNAPAVTRTAARTARVIITLPN
jgi:hypothetical protein